MAIKLSITLDGAEVVESKIESIGKAGEELSKSFNKIGQASGGGSALAKIVDDLNKAQPQLENASKSTEKLGTGLKLIGAGARLAGIEIGNLGAVSRLLNTTLVGAAAAGFAALGVAMEQSADRTRRIQNDLRQLTGSTEGGKAAFQALSDTADKMGTSFQKAAPAFESLLKSFRDASGIRSVSLPGVGGLADDANAKRTSETLVALNTILRAAGLSFSETQKAEQEFAKQIQQDGQLTAAALKQLDQYPGVLDKIKAAMGQTAVSDRDFLAQFQPQSLNRMLAILKQAQDQIPKSFDPKAPQSLDDAVQKLTTNIGKAVENIPDQPGPGAIAKFTSFIAGLIDPEGFKAALTPAVSDAFSESVNNAQQPTLEQVQALWALIGAFAVSNPIKIDFVAGQFTGPLGTFTGGGTGEFLAGGGQVRGPGTTTSDSIMAFLSNREFVVNARAVDFYGSGLFSALNSMRLPRNTFAMPKFAEGGQVKTGGSSLTLVLGGRSFAAGASEGTITALRRFATHSQLASIGRKPGFVR